MDENDNHTSSSPLEPKRRISVRCLKRYARRFLPIAFVVGLLLFGYQNCATTPWSPGGLFNDNQGSNAALPAMPLAAAGLGGPNAPKNDANHQYAFDVRGAIVSSTVVDTQTSTTITTGQEFDCNLRMKKQMVTVGTVATETVFIYDADGNKISVVQGSVVQTFFSGGKRVEQNETSGTVTAFVKYEMVEIEKSASATDPVVRTYLQDHLGTPEITLKEGRIVEAKGTLPYGGEWYRVSADVTMTKYGFNGSLVEGAAANPILDYSARHKEINAAQFTAPDTIIPDPSRVTGYNRFAYVSGNPVNRVDPSGHMECTTGGAMGTVCGVGGGGASKEQADLGYGSQENWDNAHNAWNESHSPGQAMSLLDAVKITPALEAMLRKAQSQMVKELVASGGAGGIALSAADADNTGISEFAGKGGEVDLLAQLTGFHFELTSVSVQVGGKIFKNISVSGEYGVRIKEDGGGLEHYGDVSSTGLGIKTEITSGQYGPSIEARWGEGLMVGVEAFLVQSGNIVISPSVDVGGHGFGNELTLGFKGTFVGTIERSHKFGKFIGWAVDKQNAATAQKAQAIAEQSRIPWYRDHPLLPPGVGYAYDTDPIGSRDFQRWMYQHGYGNTPAESRR